MTTPQNNENTKNNTNNSNNHRKPSNPKNFVWFKDLKKGFSEYEKIQAHRLNTEAKLDKDKNPVKTIYDIEISTFNNYLCYFSYSTALIQNTIGIFL